VKRHRSTPVVIVLGLALLAGACATRRAESPPPPVVAGDTVAPATPAAPPPVFDPATLPRVSLFPRREGAASVRPGEALLVRVEDAAGVAGAVTAQWGATAAPCLPDGSGKVWLGLLPVSRDREPGDFQLQVRIVGVNGAEATEDLAFSVRRRAYRSARLTVAPAMARIPPRFAARVEEDRQAFAAVWAAPAAQRYWSEPFLLPCAGRISSPFGERRVYNGEVSSRHSGVDIAAPQGAPVRAANAGRVALVRFCYLEGNTVVLDHGGGVFTIYCHLARARVAAGEMVERGRRIGTVGMTGRATGPHLHFGVRVQGQKIDGLSLPALAEGIGR